MSTSSTPNTIGTDTQPANTQTNREFRDSGLIPEFYINIVGDVKWRPGDGVLQPLPTVKAGVNEAISSYALSWVEDGEPQIATLAKPEFHLYVERGDIVRI